MTAVLTTTIDLDSLRSDARTAADEWVREDLEDRLAWSREQVEVEVRTYWAQTMGETAEDRASDAAYFEIAIDEVMDAIARITDELEGEREAAMEAADERTYQRVSSPTWGLRL